MPEHKDVVGIRERVHIVLRGPDGKIKDERIVKNGEEYRRRSNKRRR